MYYVIVIGSEIDSATDVLRRAEINAANVGGTVITFEEEVETLNKMYVDGALVDIPLSTEEARLEEISTLESMSAIELLSLTDAERTTKINRYKEIK